MSGIRFGTRIGRRSWVSAPWWAAPIVLLVVGAVYLLALAGLAILAAAYVLVVVAPRAVIARRR